MMGFLAVGFTWGTIILAFASMAWASSQPIWIALPVFLLAMAIIAGRQLALAILQHDATHGTLFNNKWLNFVFTDWVCARPIWNDLKKYRVHHLVHHSKTSTDEDTDISLVKPFPCSPASLKRKFLRDIFGLTGVKFLISRSLMDSGFIKWTLANEFVKLPQTGRTIGDVITTFVKNVAPTVITNGIIFGALWACGYPWLYLFWVLSYITFFSLFVRIRSMAEHACTTKSSDPFLNTRTTRAGLLARATIAPIHVNFHIEHHLMASVPYFRLPVMHRMLREKNALPLSPTYLDVLRIVSAS
jgi:fatty acid desaturase